MRTARSRVRWILLVLFIAGGFVNQPIPASAESCAPPVFYSSLPRDNEWYYGVGRNADTNAARDEAVRNLGKQVSGSIDGWDASQISDIAGPGRDRGAVIQAVDTTLEQTPLAGWEQDDFTRCKGLSYVLVRIEKSKADAYLKENAQFKAALTARFEKRMTVVEGRMADLEETVRNLEKMLEARDAGPVAGIGAPLDRDRDACGRGDRTACYAMGARYAAGQGVGRDLAKAAELFRKVCGKGEVRGCVDLGTMLYFGRGVGQDQAKAVAFWRKACDGGNGLGCSDLGAMYEHGSAGVAHDPAKAVALYRKACEIGDMRGCTDLGYMYFAGLGVGRDLAKAEEFYRKGCDMGNNLGCTHLGLMYAQGQGVGKDLAQAGALFGRACDMGDGDSCSNLGMIYEKGMGVGRDQAKAADLYRKACGLGVQSACGKSSK